MKKIYAAVSPDVSRREIENRNRSRLIAAEGMVLLENNGILPLKLKGAKIALFGNGARHTVSGGTGSGEVNAREVSSVEQGWSTRCCHYHESVAGQIRCCGSAEERSL